MADTKLTDLASLATPADGDELAIVDDSDTSMAASGTTKRITAAGLLSAERTRLDALEADKADDDAVVHDTGTETVAGVKTFSSEPIVPSLSVDGITGATTNSRYVGATAGGAPASGTFSTGDYISDAVNACFWICTSGGSPGTWVRAGSPGIELAYAEITTSPSDTTAAAGSAVAISGLSITPTLPSGPVEIKVFSPYIYNLTANKGVLLELWDTTAAAKIGEGDHWSGVAAEMDPGLVIRRHQPGAGARTYEVRRSQNGGGTAHVHAQATAPAFISCTQL